MAVCPNGCSRPYLAEIGLVGKGPGRYKRERRDGERFGDYVIPAGFIAATVNGTDFHKGTGASRSA